MSIATNRKAWHEYHIFDKYEAGIVLLGSEVKAIKESKVSIKESYVRFINNELFIIGMHIGDYSNGGYSKHESMQNRKLLMHRNELKKIKAIGKVFYLQKFIESQEKEFTDVRVLVSNHNVISSMERYSNHFITNVFQGAKYRQIILKKNTYIGKS